MCWITTLAVRWELSSLVETMEMMSEYKPSVRTEILAIPPQKKRQIMEIVKDANRTLKQWCEATGIVHFIEIDLSGKDMGRGVVMNREVEKEDGNIYCYRFCEGFLVK